MAATDFSSWVPIIWSDQVAVQAPQPSAMDHARKMQMTSSSYMIPRLVAVDVNGGSQLTDDTNDADTVLLSSYQFNGKNTLDEAEMEDSAADQVEAKSFTWLNTLHKSYDNACFGVSAALSTNPNNFQPYSSIYWRVRNNDSDVGYVANTNYTKTGSGGLSYDYLNQGLGIAEDTDFWDEENGIVIMHPRLKRAMRGVKDENGLPILTLTPAGTRGGGASATYDFMGYPVVFSRGAIVTPSFKGVTNQTLQGNPLIIWANPQHMVRGSRIEPQARFISPEINTEALEATVQTRARLGFCATLPQAFSVLEVGA
jgi:hypothetical protein